MAGLGNIYVDEALHRAKVHPECLACNLKAREVSRLHETVREVLTQGIEHRGTSIRDYVDGDGREGGFQTKLQAYGRENQPCLLCGTFINRIKVGGRSTFYCPDYRIYLKI